MTDWPAIIIQFLLDIGLRVEKKAISTETFLPGIDVRSGVLVVDDSQLLYPGDLLHEAGHLAMTDAAVREAVGNDFANGTELGAIAWSFAAAAYLGVPLDVLFHDKGYKGNAAWLRQEFEAGNFLGLPLLEWKGIARRAGKHPYPKVVKWLS